MPYADPSLILGFKPIELPDPTNMLMKALQIKTLQGQNRLQDFQLQDAESTATQRNALMARIGQPDFSTLAPDQQRAEVNRVAPLAGQPYLKGMLEARQTQGNIDKTDLDNHATQIKIAGQVFGAAAGAGPQAVLDAFDKLPPTILPPAFKQHLEAEFRADPVAAAKKFQMQALTADQQIAQGNPNIVPTDQGIAAVRKDGTSASLVPSLPAAGAPASPQTINQPYVGRQPAGIFVGDPASLYAGLQRIAEPAVRAQAVRALQNQLAGANPTQDASGVFQGAGAQGPVPIGASQQQAPGVPLMPTGPVLGQKRQEFEFRTDPMTGQTLGLPKYGAPGSTTVPAAQVVQTPGAAPVGKLSAQDQAIVDKIAAYEMPAPTGTAVRNPRMAAIVGALAEQHPEYDATQYGAKQQALKAFSTGPQGNAIRSVSVASDHLDQLAQAGEALKNGNFQLVNKIANVFDAQTGGTAPGAFNAIKQIVGDEVLKAVIGGGAGGVSDRQELAAQLRDAQTPAQLSSVIRQYRMLMGAQKDALVSQYENATGRKDAAERFNFTRKGGEHGSATSAGGWAIEKVN